jgi:pimeloyl-ACP methyl ester carboxylesterase
MNVFDHQSGQHLSVDTASIYFEQAGTPNKPVLLVLHGSLGNLTDLNPILTQLATRYTLIGIDSRGHGISTLGASRLTYERLQKDAELVLQHLNINNLSILGFDDGGVVAYRMAAYSKLQIERVVTIGSRWHYKNADSTRAVLKSMFNNDSKEQFAAAYESYQMLNPEPNMEGLQQALIKMWLDPGASGYPSFNLQRYTAPLLTIRGDEDRVVSPTALVELGALLPNAVLFNVPFAGHDAHNQQSEMIMLALNEFFGKAS